LKPGGPGGVEVPAAVDDRDPLQQGLKRRAASMSASASVMSTTVIHYNKD